MLGQLTRYHDWATGSIPKGSVFDSQEEQEIFLFCKVSRQDEGPTQILVQYKARVISVGGKADVT
jgi:hypothetical protein